MKTPKTPIDYFRGDPWTIVEEGFDPGYQRVSESVFSVANEFMGVRGYFEEGYSGDHLLGSYFNHLYELMDIHHDQLFKGFVTQGAAMLNAVDWLYTRLWVDGEQLDLAKSAFSDFTRSWTCATACSTREFVWQTASGKHLKLTFTAVHGHGVHPGRLPAHRLRAAGLLRHRCRFEWAWTSTRTTRSVPDGIRPAPAQARIARSSTCGRPGGRA